MINKAVLYLANKIYVTIELNRQQKDKVQYALEVILSDMSKILIMMILFSIIRINNSFIFILLYSIPLRINIGGFHMKKYLSCLLFSIAYYISIFYLDKYLQVETLTLIVIGIICSFVIFYIAPVVPRKRLKTSSIKVYHLKIRATIFSVTYLLLFIMINNPYTRYGIWVIIVQTILILIAKGVNSHEKNIINQTTKSTL